MKQNFLNLFTVGFEGCDIEEVYDSLKEKRREARG